MMHSKSEQQFVRHSAPNRIIIDEDDDLLECDDVVGSIEIDCSDGGSSYKIRSRRIDNSNINNRSNNNNNNNSYSYNKPPHQRCLSLPANLHNTARTVSIMITRTLDESLHSRYGSDEEGPTRRRRRSKDRPSLQFDKIKIREYSRTVGDNPSCSSGPPISISWEYNIMGEMNLDDYEKYRPPRRVQNEMVLPRDVRHEILRREWDASNKEIADSVRRNVKIKNQRKTTINNLDKATKLEEVIESASRKIRRFVTGKKSINKQVKDLEEQIDLTNHRRSKLLYLEQHVSQHNNNRESNAETAPTENGVSDDSNDNDTNDPAVHVPQLQEGFSNNGNNS